MCLDQVVFCHWPALLHSPAAGSSSCTPACPQSDPLTNLHCCAPVSRLSSHGSACQQPGPPLLPAHLHLSCPDPHHYVCICNCPRPQHRHLQLAPTAVCVHSTGSSNYGTEPGPKDTTEDLSSLAATVAHSCPPHFHQGCFGPQWPRVKETSPSMDLIPPHAPVLGALHH